MDVKKYRVHIRRPTRQWRLNKQKKGKRWLYQKWTANLTSSRLEETREESLMRNGKKWFVFKRTQSIHLSIDVTKLWDSFLARIVGWLVYISNYPDEMKQGWVSIRNDTAYNIDIAWRVVISTITHLKSEVRLPRFSLCSLGIIIDYVFQTITFC